jgi:hypothetical protein
MFVLGGVDADDSVGKNIVDISLMPIGGANIGVAAGENPGGAQTYFLARNTDSSCSIQDFSLEIQSSVGSYTYAGDAAPFLRTRQQLFRDHLRYCCPSYLDGDIQKWRKHCGILLLGADSFIRGLCSDGSQYPLNIQAKVRFANERQYLDGTAAAGNTNGASAKGIAIQQDIIVAKPIMLAIYPKSALNVSPSSAILSSQNLSHATAVDIIARKAAAL